MSKYDYDRSAEIYNELLKNRIKTYVFDCRECGGEVKLPTETGIINFKCSNCGIEYQVNNECYHGPGMSCPKCRGPERMPK